MADSNVLMPPDYLHRLLESWQPDTGLVSSPAIGCAPGNVWAELECAFLNTYQARWQGFADSVGLGFAQGKTMLFRRAILEWFGRYSRVRFGKRGGRRIHEARAKSGLRVRVVNRPFPQPLGHRTATEVWGRRLRWARLRRDTFRAYFVPEVAAGGLPPLAACAIFVGSSRIGRWRAHSSPSLRSGMAPRPSWLTPPPGTFRGDRRSYGWRAMHSCRSCGWRAGWGTGSSGAALRCASSTAARPLEQHQFATGLEHWGARRPRARRGGADCPLATGA